MAKQVTQSPAKASSSAAARPSVAGPSGSGRGEARAEAVGTPARPSGPIKVRATKLGYYDNQRRRIGDVFIIRTPKDFSKAWMETTDARVREHTTGPQAALNRELHRVAQEKAGAEGGMGQGSDEASAQDGSSPLGD
jgi:hypothetical protein